MKKLIGFAALCIAFGMVVMLFMTNHLIGLIFIALLALIGYAYFICD